MITSKSTDFDHLKIYTEQISSTIARVKQVRRRRPSLKKMSGNTIQRKSKKSKTQDDSLGNLDLKIYEPAGLLTRVFRRMFSYMDTKTDSVNWEKFDTNFEDNLPWINMLMLFDPFLRVFFLFYSLVVTTTTRKIGTLAKDKCLLGSIMSKIPGYHDNLEKEKEIKTGDKLQELSKDYVSSTATVGAGQEGIARKLIKERYHQDETLPGNSSSGKHLKRFALYEGGRTVNLRAMYPDQWDTILGVEPKIDRDSDSTDNDEVDTKHVDPKEEKTPGEFEEEEDEGFVDDFNVNSWTNLIELISESNYTLTDILESPKRHFVEIRNMVDKKDVPLKLIFWLVRFVQQETESYSAPLMSSISRYLTQRLGSKRVVKTGILNTKPSIAISNDIYLRVLRQAHSFLQPDKEVVEIGSGGEEESEDKKVPKVKIEPELKSSTKRAVPQVYTNDEVPTKKRKTERISPPKSSKSPKSPEPSESSSSRMNLEASSSSSSSSSSTELVVATSSTSRSAAIPEEQPMSKGQEVVEQNSVTGESVVEQVDSKVESSSSSGEVESSQEEASSKPSSTVDQQLMMLAFRIKTEEERNQFILDHVGELSKKGNVSIRTFVLSLEL